MRGLRVHTTLFASICLVVFSLILFLSPAGAVNPHVTEADFPC